MEDIIGRCVHMEDIIRRCVHMEDIIRRCVHMEDIISRCVHMANKSCFFERNASFILFGQILEKNV